VPVICVASVVFMLLLVVRLLAPSEIWPPAPASAPTVWPVAICDMSNRPPFTVSAPPTGSDPPTLSSTSVPALIVVPPP
jgi:hypothetical protein